MNFKAFKAGVTRDLVSTGSVYRRVWRNNTVETATVIAIDDYFCGIPHVRYQLSFGRDQRMFDEGPRVLALSSFTEQYLEPIAS